MVRLVCLLLLVGLNSISLFAVDHLKYIDFSLAEAPGYLELKCHPTNLFSYEDIKSDQYGMTRDMIELSLDAPMRQIAFLLRTLDSNRAVLMGKGGANLDILSLKFTLRARHIDGEPILEKEYHVIVSLTQDGARLTYENQHFDIAPATLTKSSNYDDYLKTFVFPFETFKLPTPSVSECVVDLHYRWPKLLLDEDDVPIFDLFPSAILWNRGPIRKIDIFLGSAYLHKEEGGTWGIESGSTLRHYAKAHELHREALSKGTADDPTLEQIGLLEELLHRFPIQRQVLERLMKAYLYHEMEPEAGALINGMQPIFATIREGLDQQARIEDRAERKRNFLLGRKQFFAKDEAVQVVIENPKAEDLITGTSKLDFKIINPSSPVLSAYCFFDDQIIGELKHEPWSIRFVTGQKRGLLPLKVMVYFENETYAETEIEIRTMPVDQELSVHLVPLRVVVSKGGTGFMTGLTGKDFEIVENGVPKEVVHFSSESAPLRIAVLMDASISMTGEKMDRAQYALHQFVSNLEPEDRVSLYTFDHKVLRLVDFSNDFKSLTPLIYNTSPQLGTALNDACLAGIQALKEQNGTRILIILSDGTDFSSVSLAKHVVDALAQSDVMVYSIVLPGSFGEVSNDAGNRFLKDLAKFTGSVSTRLVRARGVDEAMKKMAEEFRSFYYIGYYSSLPLQAKRDLKIDVKGFRAKVRHRVLQP